MSVAVVIPVFNEAKTIGVLINDLHRLMSSENISCHFIIVNDGSTDESLSIVESLAKSTAGIEIISHKNVGHGPSLLKGYQHALQYEWVLQLDSDYQYDLSAIPILWNKRQQYQLLVAERKQRNASGGRDIVTLVSRSLITLLYGKGLRDINSPYRLMKTSKLGLALQYIHPGSFAPNILIAAWFLKNKLPIFTTPAHAKTGAFERKSQMSWYIFKGCIKAVSDIFFFRFKI
ncbi:MAG: glycosyltransferase family 2 protein [Rhizobacter sp.]|nr:glycosyltransferase family 2 protein [Ferruginibacter sp.]